MSQKKKLWKKPNIIEMEIGICRYCNKTLLNTNSFVVFLSTDKNGDREKAHYSCMEKDDYKKLVEKEKLKRTGTA